MCLGGDVPDCLGVNSKNDFHCFLEHKQHLLVDFQENLELGMLQKSPEKICFHASKDISDLSWF